jgi:predicted O-methyltransferase YrrM
MIALSGLASSISVLHLDLERNQHLIELLRRNKLSRLDFLFLDHDKDAYLQDLKELEQASFVGKGVYVAADNVLFAGIDNYRQYIQLLVHKGIVRSNLVRTNLEYSEQEREIEPSSSVYEDGIGKFKISPGLFSSKLILVAPLELTLYLEHPIDAYTSNY